MMMFDVARTHWIKFGRDRAALIMSFIVPVIFFSTFAIMFSGVGAGMSKLHVAIIDQSVNGKSTAFLEALRSEKSLDLIDRALDGQGNRTLPMTPAAAENEIRSANLGLAIIIPRDFSDARLTAIDDGARPNIIIMADTSDPVSSRVLGGLLHNVAIRTVRSISARNGAKPGTPSARVGTLLDVNTLDVLGASKANPRISFSAAGLGVMFLLFTAAAASGAIIEESESGTLDRILASKVSMTQLLLGKLLFLVGLSTAQLFVTFLWGALFFGVELRQHFAGFLIMTIATSLAASAFGLLLAAICRTRAQLGALSNLIVLVMSALGGSMFPRFMMPEKLQNLGLFTINGWAIDGFLKVFWRDEPLIRLWPQVTVLVVGGAMIFTAARVVARKWETS